MNPIWIYLAKGQLSSTRWYRCPVSLYLLVLLSLRALEFLVPASGGEREKRHTHFLTTLAQKWHVSCSHKWKLVTWSQLDAEGSGKCSSWLGCHVLAITLCFGRRSMIFGGLVAHSASCPFSTPQILMSALISAFSMRHAPTPPGATFVPATLALHQAMDSSTP